MRSSETLFHPGENCWRQSLAKNVALLVDCDNYYRAVYESICAAQKSIFIIGWEIDSRTCLLRGEHQKNAVAPSVLVDLLAWKAERNPQLQIYLLRWDPSVVFMGDRELLATYAWAANTPENIHICLDETAPFGASHHQKIILVDERVAFMGGMDIARQRWDDRRHRPENPYREDINGPYEPYHDVQVVVDGPVVKEIAELTKERWFRATLYEPISVGENFSSEVWPKSFPPEIKNIKCAIARTIPETENEPAVQEVFQTYLDMIARAEKFIYIENQFLTSPTIARALNTQLREMPQLRVLIVSSYEPKGIFERESMWAGRLEFKKILEDGIGPFRVRMVYCGVRDSQKRNHYKRIHSKVMVIDDHYLRVGSANLNNRSMGFDTECDLVFEAKSREEKNWIVRVRDDLIVEHSSYGYEMFEIDDSRFTAQTLQPIAQTLADPPRAGLRKVLRNPSGPAIFTTLLVVIFLVTVGIVSYNENWLKPATVQNFLEKARDSDFALPLTCLIYTVAAFIFFPVTMLSLLTAAVFGALWGPIYAMIGALVSAAVMFWVGRGLGLRWLRSFFGSRVRTVDEHFKKAGVVGVAAIRFLPIAPYSLVNLAAGISSVTFFDYMAGTFIGFLPGLLAKSLIADSLVNIFLHPTYKSKVYLAIGVLLWLVFSIACYYFAKSWTKRRRAA